MSRNHLSPGEYKARALGTASRGKHACPMSVRGQRIPDFFPTDGKSFIKYVQHDGNLTGQRVLSSPSEADIFSYMLNGGIAARIFGTSLLVGLTAVQSYQRK